MPTGVYPRKPLGLRTVIDGRKTCRKCGRSLPVARFRAKNRDRGWLQPWCRSCETAANLDAQRKRKAEMVGHEPSVCYLCGEPISWESANLDRINPRANGGRYVRGNVEWACSPCNQLKNGFTLTELLERVNAIRRHYFGVSD